MPDSPNHVSDGGSDNKRCVAFYHIVTIPVTTARPPEDCPTKMHTTGDDMGRW